MCCCKVIFYLKKPKELANKKRCGLLRHTSLKVKEQDKTVVTKTFHGAGLVVIIDKNKVG